MKNLYPIFIAGLLLFAACDNTTPDTADDTQIANDKAAEALSYSATDVYTNGYDNEDSLALAIQLIDSAIALSPDNIVLYESKLMFLKELDGRYDEKVAVLNKIISQEDFAEYRVARNVYTAKKDGVALLPLLEQDLQHYKQLSEKYPDSSMLLLNKVLIMKYTHRPEDVQDDLKKIMTIDNTFRDYTDAIKREMAQFDDTEEAVEVLMRNTK